MEILTAVKRALLPLAMLLSAQCRLVSSHDHLMAVLFALPQLCRAGVPRQVLPELDVVKGLFVSTEQLEGRTR